MLVVLIAALVVIGAGLSLVATSNDGTATAKTDAPTNTVELAIDSMKLGAKLPDDAFGLSFEARVLTQASFSEGNLVQYLKTLGPGVLRVGGNSSDRMYWTSRAEAPPAWAQGTLTPADIDRLASVVEAAGWSAILTVNLKEFDPGRAAEEVAYASSKLGKRLRAVAIGNEPNVYYDEADDYFADFVKYVERIRQSVPDVSFIGPDAGSSAAGSKWVKDVVALESKRKTKEFVALSQHTYPQSACNDKTTDISSLLKASTYSAEKKVANDLVELAGSIGVPALISETNSVSCAGQEGVSDVFAASLWGLGHGLAQSAEGVTGSYFHGSLAQCGSEPPYNHYTPLCASTKKDLDDGKLRAQPLYYSLLALGRIGEGEFVAISNGEWESVHAFGVKQGDRMTLALINVTSPETNGASRVRAKVNGSYSSAKSYQLISKDRGLDDRKDITFGGVSVKNDGTFEEPAATSESFDGQTLDVVVPAGSALIVQLT